jgi:pimeloyl-ACP methyl ester carboxylesterase
MRLSRAVVSLLMAQTLWVGPAAARPQGIGPEVFIVPADAPTVPLGTLGHVEKRGTGPQTLVLIPGMSFGWRIWDEFMQRNADRYTMYAITLPGFDGTPSPPTPAESELFELCHWTNGAISGILDLIEREKLQRPIIVGHHNLGDHLAMRLGLEHPDLVGGVIVVSGEPSRGVPSDLDGDPRPSVDDHRIFVSRHLVPRMRTQSLHAPSEVRVPAASLCRDDERAGQLDAEQSSVPRYVEYRYFLEFMTTDLALALPSMRAPLLVIEARGDAEAMIDRIMELYLKKGMSEEEARQMVDSMLQQRFGSLENAMSQLGGDPAWEDLRPKVPGLTIEYIEETGIFIMDDQPAKLDALIQTFATARRSAAGASSTP